MSEPINGTSGTSILDRAESLLDSLGARLKDAGANLKETVVTPTEAAFSDAAAQTGTQAKAQIRPATDRAEATLDQAGERLGIFAAAVNLRLRKTVALAREEAEDIWAEAQSLRQK
ncbi:MAG: hypothetical protein M3Y13_09520 [Armatimonadota bacterium]|nr:hypothetical protein [Armatimonadota bacterium]